MSELIELALRCEQATGPDRELDAEIAVKAGPPSGDAFSASYLHSVGNSFADIGKYTICPAYTASLDAAMTLVPEGCGWVAGWGQMLPDEPMGGARVTRNARFIGYGANYDAFAEAEAATPALALCAAALRARASLASDPTP